MSLTEFESEKTPPDEGVLLVLGGDGTLLRTVRNLTSDKVAVLGVNFGRSGFLCQAEPGEMLETIEQVLSAEVPVAPVMRLAVHQEDRLLGNVLNEAYLCSRKPGTVIEYIIRMDGGYIDDVADGVVLATPIGSTAYAMSAGGPAVDEDVEAVIVVPMASLKNMRPMVLSAKTSLEVEVRKGEAQIILDGHTTYPLPTRRVRVEKSPHPVMFVRLGGGKPMARRLRKRQYGTP